MKGVPVRLLIDVHLDYRFARPADVLLQVEVAAGADQQVEAQALTIWSDTPIRAVPGEEGSGQRCWAHGDERLVAEYRATVEVTRARVDLGALDATPPRSLPAAAVPYLLPSRYCPSDRLEGFVAREFAGLTGGAMAAALAAWVRDAIDYRPNASAGTTTALDTFASRAGVCRDYAHLLVALARAADIPARCVSVYAPGVDPPDFHAVAELWLAGGWHLVDATGMASCQDLVRVAAGRDATDIAFMTIFGSATLARQEVRVVAAV